MNTRRELLVGTGLVGLVAAALVGTGEFLLHFDALARYDGTYVFFEGVSETRATLGHFIGVLGVPLYLVGVWHLAQMLRPANRVWAAVAFFVMCYGFLARSVWIGSRASAAALVAVGKNTATEGLLELYDLRYETYPMQHQVCIEEIRLIGGWLAERLPPATDA